AAGLDGHSRRSRARGGVLLPGISGVPRVGARLRGDRRDREHRDEPERRRSRARACPGHLYVGERVRAPACRAGPGPRPPAGRRVWMATRDDRGRGAGFSYPEFQEYRASARAFEGIAATASTAMNLSDDDRAPERVQGTYMSANAFALLRVAPILGRGFRPED